MSARFLFRYIFVLALTCVCQHVFGDQTAGGKSYRVKLERPSKVGEKADISITATSTETATFTFKDREPERAVTEMKVTIEGCAQTLAINAGGWETHASLKVTRAEVTRDGATTKALPSGTLLDISLDGDKTIFKVDGSPVSDETAEVLSEVLFLHDPRTHSDDDVYANTKLQKPGATWLLNAELAAKDLTVLGLPVGKETVSGESKLIDLQTSDGVPCLHVQLEENADQIKAEMAPGLVPGITSMQMLLHVLVPVDLESQYGKASLATRVTMTATRPAGKDGPAATIRRVIERGRSVSAKPVE